jgi:large subunit ribosomal protein L29
MKIEIIRDLNDVELKEAIARESLALTKLTLGHAISTLENPLKIRQTRRTIARLKTEQRQRYINKQNAAK